MRAPARGLKKAALLQSSQEPIRHRMLSRSFAYLAPIGLCFALSACSPAASRHGLKAATARHQAPDFEARDAAGQTFHLSDYKGKVVILNFWATWCPPCKMEIPWFIDFERTYKNQGFAVVGLSLDEDGWDVVRPFMAAYKMNYRVALGSSLIEQLYGGGGGIESLPTTFMLDCAGRIASKPVGLVSRKDYENEIKELLR
jgi:cytochrome c biogenesis protein CcmG/thiol:disulfide interchange protein DsbE